MSDHSTSAASVASPCTNVCRMDVHTGWCEGCLRTIDEIAAWSSMDAEGKRAVLDEIALRRIALRQDHPSVRSERQ